MVVFLHSPVTGSENKRNFCPLLLAQIKEAAEAGHTLRLHHRSLLLLAATSSAPDSANVLKYHLGVSGAAMHLFRAG